jgi:small-conductance mechanosensitive channel
MDLLNSVLEFFKNQYYLEKGLRILLITVISIFAIGIIRFITINIIQKKAHPQVKMITKKLINYSGFGILTIIIFSELGLELSAILGAAGVLGIAIGIASQKSLGNIISGFFIVSENSFEIGDVIRIGERVGTVQSVELLSIMLRTFDNMLIRIPNEVMISTDFVNITRFPIRRMDIAIQVSYREDLSLVLEILNDISVKNKYCLDEPSPFIMLKDFDESGINVLYGPWFDKRDYRDLKNSLIMDIMERFRESGITIPYKHITIDNAQDIGKGF